MKALKASPLSVVLILSAPALAAQDPCAKNAQSPQCAQSRAQASAGAAHARGANRASTPIVAVKSAPQVDSELSDQLRTQEAHPVAAEAGAKARR